MKKKINFCFSIEFSERPKHDGMMHLEPPSKSYRNHVQSVEHQRNETVAACTWCVLDPAAHLNGVGCVKRNGPETVWAHIGSVKIEIRTRNYIKPLFKKKKVEILPKRLVREKSKQTKSRNKKCNE